MTESQLTRDFTVAVFVVHGNAILLHFHQKLGRWLPPGGHIEPNELPDEAAVREVFEETGVRVELDCDNLMTLDLPGQPRPLCRPAGIQLATIRAGHEHIDLVYFGRGEPVEARDGVGWFTADQWGELALTDEVLGWCTLALQRVGASRSTPAT